jgi:hypothetical protein
MRPFSGIVRNHFPDEFGRNRLLLVKCPPDQRINTENVHLVQVASGILSNLPQRPFGENWLIQHEHFCQSMMHVGDALLASQRSKGQAQGQAFPERP